VGLLWPVVVLLRSVGGGSFMLCML
jgi:hypothetical protein